MAAATDAAGGLSRSASRPDVPRDPAESHAPAGTRTIPSITSPNRINRVLTDRSFGICGCFLMPIACRTGLRGPGAPIYHGGTTVFRVTARGSRSELLRRSFFSENAFSEAGNRRKSRKLHPPIHITEPKRAPFHLIRPSVSSFFNGRSSDPRPRRTAMRSTYSSPGSPGEPSFCGSPIAFLFTRVHDARLSYAGRTICRAASAASFQQIGIWPWKRPSTCSSQR